MRESYIAGLIGALANPSHEIRLRAAHFLGLAGEQTAVPSLIEAYGHNKGDIYVQAEIIRSLGQIAGTASLPLMDQALIEGALPVRFAAILALEQIAAKGCDKALALAARGRYDANIVVRQEAERIIALMNKE